MECNKAQELIALAIDGQVDPEELAAAREHCSACAECASVTRTLDRIASLEAPKAPESLVGRLLELGAAESVLYRQAAARAEAAEKESPALEHIGPPAHERPSWWAPRLTTFAAAAAVLLVALVATGISLGGLLGKDAATETLSERTADTAAVDLAAPQGATESATGGADVTKLYGDIAAPPYVVVDTIVYSPIGVRSVSAAALVTATPVMTALDTGADPVTLPAYTITGEAGSAVLRFSDGTYLGLSAVTRQFGGRTFKLMSGSPIAAYGQWPTLPARFQPPTEPDGSPTFSFFGKDDSGALIYVPPGVRPVDGFAVAPGSAPDDPAAGNPNWTWWEPL